MPTEVPAARRSEIRRAVLGAKEALWRELPWRATRDPWCVLVSEVMLQQTQAPRVVEPYLRFVGRFPTPDACAAAGAAEVVRAWEGLGYNRRARFLHAAALAIVERHGGAVPADLDSLRGLPGIGPYTARAVLAFAFEAPVGVVDTNVARVLVRAVAGRPLRPAESQSLADELVPEDAAWAYNQALFDIGARHCTATRPRCTGCPLAPSCRWVQAGRPEPDPASRLRQRQSAFAGSDRQGRGRLVAALRRGPVADAELAAAAGWPEEPGRAARIAAALVDEGMAEWAAGSLTLA